MIHGRHSVEESFSKYYVALIERYAGCWLMVAGCWLLVAAFDDDKKQKTRSK
jgi:putative Mn2+ efflux pump MntP